MAPQLSCKPHSITSSARASSVGGTVEAEHFGGLEVDRQFELGGLFNRKVGRFGTLQNPVNVSGRPPELAIDVRSIRHEAADRGVLLGCIDRRQALLQSKINDIFLTRDEKRIGKDEQGIGVLMSYRCERTAQLVSIPPPKNFELNSQCRSRHFRLFQHFRLEDNV